MTNAKKVNTTMLHEAAERSETGERIYDLYVLLQKTGVLSSLSINSTSIFANLFGCDAFEIDIKDRSIFLTLVACYYKDLQNEH